MADNYSAWKIKETDFPKDGTVSEKIQFFLQYGVLAPSTHNSQAWLYKITDDTVLIEPDLSRRLPFADPDERNLYISLGCFVENIIIAANYFSFTTKVAMNTSDKKVSVKLTFSADKSVKTKEITTDFKVITDRFSNKLTYNNKPIPTIKLDILKKRNLNSTSTVFFSDKSTITKLADQYYESAMVFAAQSGFRKEIVQWMRRNDTKEYDGMPGFVNGFSHVQNEIGKFLLKNFPPFGKVASKKYHQSILSSPTVGAILTQKDDIPAWIDTGRAYQKLSLRATAIGLHITILAAIIEDKEGRKELVKEVERTTKRRNQYPQLFYRIGYCDKKIVHHSPRRKLVTMEIKN